MYAIRSYYGFFMLKNAEGNYFTWEEYEKLVKDDQTDKDKNTIYLYTVITSYSIHYTKLYEGTPERYSGSASLGARTGRTRRRCSRPVRPGSHDRAGGAGAPSYNFV